VIHFDQTGKRHDFPQRVPNVGDFRVFSSNQVMFWSESQLIFWDLPLFLKRAEEEKKKKAKFKIILIPGLLLWTLLLH